ncbi:hypothetical protein KIPB_013921, partial [Kipferlia bialata]
GQTEGLVAKPETLPAQADSVDLDDDLREMIAETKARLANTKGKKAKRRARVAQMIEARRMATVQRRRQLKVAGLATNRRLRKLRHKQTDFNAEIFQQNINASAGGPFDASKEMLSLSLSLSLYIYIYMYIY